MRDISSLEIGAVVRELEPFVDGSRLRKFYDLGSNSFKFAFYKSNATSLVYVKLLKTINTTQYSETAENATPFAMGVRKRLDNSVIDSIEQVKGDRVIALNIDKGVHRIVMEMYGKGNMLLLDKEEMVELCYRKISQKDREIRIGSHYRFPESKSEDVLSLSKERAMLMMETLEINKSLINSLGARLNVGPLYLEDIIKRAKVDPRAKTLSGNERAAISRQVLLFLDRLKSEKPRMYLKGGEVEDYALCGIDKYEALEKKEFATFCELLDALHIADRTALPNTEKNERLKELNINISKQLELADTLAKDSIEYANYGRAIFQRMHEINSLISYLTENKRATLEQVRAQFPHLGVSGLDLKNKTVKLSL